MSAPAFDAGRVLRDLRRLQAATAGPKGARRLCWTPDWVAARRLLREELASLPVEVDVDAAGNLWAYLRGASDDTVVVGSHLDSVPSGGWLDGALGVMGGLEVLRALAAQGRPARTVALVDWADEEGARFGRSLFGSAAVAGTLELDVLSRLTDRDGAALPAVLAEHGVDIADLDASRARLDRVAAYLELHIEQGPALEAAGAAIGVVTGTVGIERKRVVFRGQAAHAGTMPMAMRRDSARAASRFALGLAEIAVEHAGVATVGSLACRPGVVTAVAGETVAMMDMRHVDASALAAMYAAAQELAERGAAREGCEVAWEHVFSIAPVPFDDRLVDLARESVRAISADAPELPSGALHDASEMGRVVPTAMIFTSSTAGLSHTQEEDTPEDHLRAGCDAFWSLVQRVLSAEL